MYISTPTKGSTAFLRRTPDPNAAGGGVGREASVEAPSETVAPTSDVAEERVLDAVARLEPEARPDATLGNIAIELAESPADVERAVKKLQDGGFLAAIGAAGFELSEIGKRALRYSKLAGS